jgi:deoxyribonuclease IV
LKLGCHLSISSGLTAAAQQALRLGAESFQIFTKNPRAFRGKAPDPDAAAKGVAFCREQLLPVVAHAPYITNLSTPDEALRAISIASLVLDLQIAEAYGAVGLVCHMGKHVAMGEEYGMKRMAETIDMILDQYRGPVPFLLENTAGQGTELGTRLEQCLEARAITGAPERIGFCFDTCHAFVSGQYVPETWADLVAQARRSGYWQLVKAVHLNDSKAEAGSRKDRHANLGKGFIGEEGIGAILRSGAFEGLPVILETPVDSEEEYGPEMAYARSLYQ